MFEEFYYKYESEEHEVIALMGRSIGCNRDGFCACPSIEAIMMGALFCDSGKLETRTMHLRFPVEEKDMSNEKGFKRFSVGQVCRLKIRKLKDEFAQNHHVPLYCLFDVISTHEEFPELNSVLEEYHKEVLLEDDVLGTCKLDKDFEMFVSTVNWCGEPTEISFEVDAFAKDTWTKNLNAAKSMVLECDTWDRNMRDYAASELTELANEKLEYEYEYSDYYVEKPETLTEDEFADKLSLSSIDIFIDGKFIAYYVYDDLAIDSYITVSGSVKHGIEDAQIDD